MGAPPANGRRNLRRFVLALILLVCVAFGVFVWQAVSASRALLDARAQAEQVQAQIRAGDFDGAARTLDRLGRSTAKARAATDGVLWDLGRRTPLVGPDIAAVQTASAVVDSASRENGPVALELSKALRQGTFRPAGGRIDLEAVEGLTPAVAKAAGSIERASTRLDAIRTEDLVFPFNDLVGDLTEQIDNARSATTATATAFELLPEMLGGDGPRDYLLMIQNPAELRSTGGLPGALAVLHADQGRLTMGWQGSAADLDGAGGPAVKLRDDTRLRYGSTVATDFRDSNFTPDFPEAARIARALLARSKGIEVDGVVSVDPIALSALLAGTGPIQAAPGITLTSANVAPILLNQTYQSIPDPVAQNTFFANVARKVFEAVIGGQGNQDRAVKGLASAVGQHRVLLWSAHPREQAKLSGTAIAGELGGKTRGNSPEVGIYLNDSLAGKADYYLQYRSAASPVDCRKGGAQDLRATVSFTSTMPEDFAHLSPWIIGDGSYAPRGTIAVNVRIYAPYGGRVTGLTVNGRSYAVTDEEHHGRQVAQLPLSLKPGEKAEVVADIRTARGQDGDGTLNVTPGMVPAPNGVRIASACH